MDPDHAEKQTHPFSSIENQSSDRHTLRKAAKRVPNMHSQQDEKATGGPRLRTDDALFTSESSVEHDHKWDARLVLFGTSPSLRCFKLGQLSVA